MAKTSTERWRRLYERRVTDNLCRRCGEALTSEELHVGTVHCQKCKDKRKKTARLPVA